MTHRGSAGVCDEKENSAVIWDLCGGLTALPCYFRLRKESWSWRWSGRSWQPPPLCWRRGTPTGRCHRDRRHFSLSSPRPSPLSLRPSLFVLHIFFYSCFSAAITSCHKLIIIIIIDLPSEPNSLLVNKPRSDYLAFLLLRHHKHWATTILAANFTVDAAQDVHLTLTPENKYWPA